MAACEILYSLKNRRLGRYGLFTLKLDISKAYDRVLWRFIEIMLLKMGFSNAWVNRIMRFVTSVNYSLMANMVVGERFFPNLRV